MTPAKKPNVTGLGFKKLRSFLLLLLIASCISCATKSDGVHFNKVATTFLGGSSQNAHNIKLSFTNAGQFDYLTSTVTAQIKSQAEKDEMLKLATQNAKQQILEFIHVELQSERFIISVTNSIANSDAVPKHKGTASNTKLAYLVRDSVNQKRNEIIKSAFVEDAVLDVSSGLMVVTVRAGRKN